MCTCTGYVLAATMFHKQELPQAEFLITKLGAVVTIMYCSGDGNVTTIALRLSHSQTSHVGEKSGIETTLSILLHHCMTVIMLIGSPLVL